MARIKHESEDDKLKLTPMIDVVFLLLIFFILTASANPRTPLHELTVDRPQHDDTIVQPVLPPGPTIVVSPRGYFFNWNHISLPKLCHTLRKLAPRVRNPRILVVCEPDSAHKQLVHVLDACSAAGLTNLSVVSRASAGIP